MPLFSAKLDYALRAIVDLAMQPVGETCQSREISVRQEIRGPYLDQILAVLKRDGLVRSVRGAGGGYTLARAPNRITVGEVVRAIVGDRLLVGAPPSVDPSRCGVAFVVRAHQERAEVRLNAFLEGVTIADLVRDKHLLDDSQSVMPAL